MAKKKSIFDTIKDVASRAYDQINPLDNGRTATQRTPTNNRSGISQVVSGAKGLAGSVVKPLAQFPLDVGDLTYNKFVAPTFHLPQQQLQNNPVLGGISRATGANGSVKQAVGSGIQTGLTLATGGLEGVAEGAASRLAVPAAVRTVAPRVATGAVVGGGFNAGQGISEGHTARQVLTRDLPIGAAVGGALPLAGAAAGKVVRTGADALANRTPLNQSGKVLLRDGEDPAMERFKSQLTPIDTTLHRGINDVNIKNEHPDRPTFHADNPDYAKTYGDTVKSSAAKGKMFTYNNIHSHSALADKLAQVMAQDPEAKLLNPREIHEIRDKYLSHREPDRVGKSVYSSNMPEIVKRAYAKLGVDYVKVPGEQYPGNVKLADGSEIGHQDEIIQIPKPKTTPPDQSGNALVKDAPTPTPAKTLRTRASTINTARMNISDQAKEDLEKTVQDNQAAIKDKVGSPLTIAEVVNRAKVKNGVLQTGRTKKQTLESTALLKNTRDRVAELQQKTSSGQALTAKEQSELIQHTVTIASRQADIARQLGSLRAMASPEEKTLLNTALEKLAKQGHDTDTLLNAAKNFNLNDPKQLTEFYRMFDKASKEDWFDKLRYSSMLSSPITHIRNAAANLVGGTVVTPATKVVAGGLDTIRAAATHTPRQRFAGEAGAYAKGYGNSLGDAAQAFKDVMSGKSIVNNPDVNLSATLPLATKGAAGKLDSILSVTGKLMEAADAFGSELATGGERKALGYRQSKGVKVKNLDTQAHETAQHQLFRSDLGGTDQGYLLNAIDFIPQTIFKARSSANPVTRTISKLVFPFVKTPVNISKQMLEYSPLGLSTAIGAADKTNQIAKAVVGTMGVGLAGAGLAAHDALTFSTPTDPNQKKRFLREGKQPYSIKIGNKWVSYQYLHPAISFQLAAIASVKQALDSGKIDDPTAEKVLTGLAGASKFFVDQSYFKSGQDFISNIQGSSLNSPVSTAASFGANTVSQAIPFRALATWIDNMTDQTQRKTDYTASFLQQFGQNLGKQLPGISNKTPATTDAAGNPLQKPHPLVNAFSPARVSTDTGGKVSDIYAPAGGDAAKQTAYRAAGLTGKDATRFLEMTSAQQHDAALKDPNMKKLYTIKQTVDTHNKPDLVLPDGLDSTSVDTLNKYNRLTTTEKQKLYETDPAAKYQYDEAAYQRDKALGNYSKAEQAVKETSLEKESVGSNYSQDVRDVYGMSQKNMADYLASNPDQETVNQLYDYDQALLDAGIITTSKFKNYAPGDTPSTGGSGSSKKISTPSVSFGSRKTAPAPKISTSGSKARVAVKARTRTSAKGTLKIKRG